MSKDSTRISFVTAVEKRQRLDDIAEIFGMNRSSIINEAIDHYIALHEWQLEHIQKGVGAARRGDFATDSEVKGFFNKYGNPE